MTSRDNKLSRMLTADFWFREGRFCFGVCLRARFACGSDDTILGLATMCARMCKSANMTKLV